MKPGTGWISLFALALAGCAGGGGSGSGLMTMTPPPGPTYPTLDTLVGNTAASSAGAAVVNFNRQNTPTATASAAAATLNFTYDASSQTYVVAANGLQQSFGPADLQASPSGYYLRSSTGADGAAITNSLQINRDNFSYSGWGVWLNGTSNGGVQNFDRFYFTYGIPTQAGDLPRSGTGTYTLGLTGIIEGEGAQVTGSGTLKADFAASTVGISISPGLIERPGQTVATPLGTMTGSGPINTATNRFSTPLSGGGYTGGADGGFYGPQGTEVGAAFHITNGAGNAVAGVMTGRKQ